MSLLDKLDKFQKKDEYQEEKETPKKPLQEAKKISPEISKSIEITEKMSHSKSLELNLIKCLYANRFGSTTNKLKSDMQKAIINEWNKENRKIKKEV